MQTQSVTNNNMMQTELVSGIRSIKAGADLAAGVKALEADLPADLSKSFTQALTLTKTLAQKVQASVQEGFSYLQKKIASISLRPIIASINSVATDVEKIFNVVACLPFIGGFGGSLRAIIGHVQIAAGVVIASIAEIGLFVENRKEGESPLRHKWQTLSKLGTEHTIHGCLNVLRGLGETAFATVTPFGLGNVVLLVPNMCNKREFNPFFEYGTLASHKCEVPAV